MKKGYTGKKRTSIALDPDLTQRIEKLLKNSGRKLSKYTQEAIKKELDKDETDKAIKKLDKLMGSAGYQKIKQLEGEIKELKEYHITEKKINEQFKKLKSGKIAELSKKVEGQQLRLDKIDREAELDNEIYGNQKEINNLYDKLIKNNDDDVSWQKMQELEKIRDRLYEDRDKLGEEE